MSAATLEIFFDGECPLCRREIAMLSRLDRHGRLVLTDIAAPGFDPRGTGRDLDTLMGRIHARTLPSGEMLEGVEVFRRAYAAIGLGPLVALSRARPIEALLERGYDWFARNRLRLTGRSEAACASDRCAVPERADTAREALT
jgi:predicted DCC family thiol-disulfide oxidoreductase YuxK